MRQIKYTGERYIPGSAAANVRQDHERRYRHVSRLVRGKKVLDVACGSGYGTRMLAAKAASVVGVDNSYEALGLAKKNYLKKSGVVVQTDAAGLSFSDNAFDVVVSFETIEHLKDPVEFLSEVKRVLSRGGVFVVSTPVKKGKDLDEFHRHEFTRREFLDLLRRYFRVEKLEGQRFMFSPLFKLFSYQTVNRLKKVSLIKNFYRRCYGRDEIKPFSSAWLFVPNFLIVTCKNEK